MRDTYNSEQANCHGCGEMEDLRQIDDGHGTLICPDCMEKTPETLGINPANDVATLDQLAAKMRELSDNYVKAADVIKGLKDVIKNRDEHIKRLQSQKIVMQTTPLDIDKMTMPAGMEIIENPRYKENNNILTKEN